MRPGPLRTCHDPNDREDLLVEVLKSGLPQLSSPGLGKSIVIVGAGISGLVGEYLVTILQRKFSRQFSST